MRAGIALAAAMFFSGCLGASGVVERYVCADGWLAKDVEECQGRGNVCPAAKCPVAKCPDCPQCKAAANTTGAAESKPGPDGSCLRLGCPAGTAYAASVAGGKYHVCGCPSARRIKGGNLVCYRTASEAQAAGKTPCSSCIGT